MKTPVRLILFLCLASGAFAADSRKEYAAVLASAPDAERGERLFAACTGCHGLDGAGSTWGSVPRISGQHYRVLVRQIVDFRRGKRWDARMEDVAKDHELLPSSQDIADVAWYISELSRDGIRGVGDGQYIELGQKLFADKCSSCHGRNGEGEGTREVPVISGQHAGYLARQIYDAVDGRRPPLTRSHRKLFEPLSFEEVLGLTDYLSRVGWAPTSRVGWAPTSSIMRTNSATDSAFIFSMTRAR